jgi:hypothetical protein
MAPVSNIPSPETFFAAAQQPVAWLLTAERLAEAAEVIVASQAALEEQYQRAYEAAVAELEASPNGIAEIRHREPNYLPAGMLYGFAIENALKGLIIARGLVTVSGVKIDPKIQTHDMVFLATSVGITLDNDERDVLATISMLAEWAGRYPVPARSEHKHKRLWPMPVVTNQVLDWPNRQEVIRGFFSRTKAELETATGGPRDHFGVVVLLPD